MQKNKFIFLIRAYNEASHIGKVIDGIIEAWYTEILVVDDGSTDGTNEFLREKYEKKIHIVRHVLNRGWGAALETGFSYVRLHAEKYDWRYIVTFDADGQMNIADMKTFMEYLQNHPDTEVIFGSRFIGKTRSNIPWYRRLVLIGWRIFTSLISGVNLTDAHNGYRLLFIDVVRKLTLTMDGMEYASELVDEIHNLGVHIHEVPVNIHYDAYTLGKWQRFGWPLRIALRMIYKKFF